jgi:hypothetical protein
MYKEDCGEYSGFGFYNQNYSNQGCDTFNSTENPGICPEGTIVQNHCSYVCTQPTPIFIDKGTLRRGK